MHKVTFILLVIGGLNWGIAGALNYDIIGTLLGGFANGLLVTVVAALVGLSAIYEVVKHKGSCNACSASAGV